MFCFFFGPRFLDLDDCTNVREMKSLSDGAWASPPGHY